MRKYDAPVLNHLLNDPTLGKQIVDESVWITSWDDHKSTKLSYSPQHDHFVMIEEVPGAGVKRTRIADEVHLNSMLRRSTDPLSYRTQHHPFNTAAEVRDYYRKKAFEAQEAAAAE